MAGSLKEKLLAPETRLLLLKSLSLGAGLILVLAGIVGCSAPITGGGLVYTIGSLYAVVFGLVVLTIELKDKTKLVSAFYHWIDTYIKFLTLQRGKGIFYLGVGLLVLFMSAKTTSTSTTGASITTNYWGVNNVAALFLAIVGFLHTFYIIREKGSHLGPGLTANMAPSDGLDFSSGQPGVGGTRTQWNKMVEEGANAAL